MKSLVDLDTSSCRFLSVSLTRALAFTDHFFLSPDFDEIDDTCGF